MNPCIDCKNTSIKLRTIDMDEYIEYCFECKYCGRISQHTMSTQWAEKLWNRENRKPGNPVVEDVLYGDEALH